MTMNLAQPGWLKIKRVFFLFRSHIAMNSWGVTSLGTAVHMVSLEKVFGFLSLSSSLSLHCLFLFLSLSLNPSLWISNRSLFPFVSYSPPPSLIPFSCFKLELSWTSFFPHPLSSSPSPWVLMILPSNWAQHIPPLHFCYHCFCLGSYHFCHQGHLSKTQLYRGPAQHSWFRSHLFLFGASINLLQHSPAL